eukprot:2562775-Rhodomonas_salina.1
MPGAVRVTAGRKADPTESFWAGDSHWSTHPDTAVASIGTLTRNRISEKCAATPKEMHRTYNISSFFGIGSHTGQIKKWTFHTILVTSICTTVAVRFTSFRAATTASFGVQKLKPKVISNNSKTSFCGVKDCVREEQLSSAMPPESQAPVSWAPSPIKAVLRDNSPLSSVSADDFSTKNLLQQISDKDSELRRLQAENKKLREANDTNSRHEAHQEELSLARKQSCQVFTAPRTPIHSLPLTSLASFAPLVQQDKLRISVERQAELMKHNQDLTVRLKLFFAARGKRLHARVKGGGEEGNGGRVRAKQDEFESGGTEGRKGCAVTDEAGRGVDSREEREQGRSGGLGALSGTASAPPHSRRLFRGVPCFGELKGEFESRLSHA